MAVDFDVEMNQFPGLKVGRTMDEIADEIETWLDGLSITTLHNLYTEYVHGFYVCIVVYV